MVPLVNIGMAAIVVGGALSIMVGHSPRLGECLFVANGLVGLFAAYSLRRWVNRTRAVGGFKQSPSFYLGPPPDPAEIDGEDYERWLWGRRYFVSLLLIPVIIAGAVVLAYCSRIN
jgi:hypothetical protein